MCMFPSKTCKVKSFSEKTWTRFLECVSKWKFLDGPQAKIAKNFDVTGVSSGIPRRGGFHQICYARFTDSQRFEWAKKNLEKHHDDAEFFEGVYKRSLHANPEIPSPDHHGWKMENGELIIHWMNLPPAPESLMDLIHCSAKCKKSQCTDANICTCLQNKVPCTDLCKCIRDTCCQITGHNAVDDDDDDTDDNNDDDTDNDNDINEVA